MKAGNFILLCLAGWINRDQQAVIEYLQEEIRILKEIHGGRPRFNDRQRRRLAAKARKLGFGRLKEVANLATPQTLLRWYRTLIAKKYDSSKQRSSGRPRTQEEIVQLVVRMAKENERCGYTRIRDALDNLGHEVSRGTVANILKDHGIEPAPERGLQTTWAEFLRRHWDVMAATDFFTVEIWTLKGIVRYQVLFVIRLATREVRIAGTSAQCLGIWMEQVARNLTDGFDGFLKGSEFLIHDRDPLFTAGFKRILHQEGIQTIRLPKRSPNLNAFAERFVRSIKEECLDQMIFFSERSLRYAITEYVAHYHGERNHQGLEGRIIRPQFRD
ncbi:MAG: integrase core domain-containing protein, partial [Verrucomicrobiales bacterium]|nr:integrase core domain-containing protein [Verrucomicrobiales bacterium]